MKLDPAKGTNSTLLLLQSALLGEETARNALAKRYLPRLRRMACARVPENAPFEAEDIVQETLLRILAIHSVLEANGRIGLVMELIEGQSFDEIIQESGPFSAGEASRVGAELCRALAAVHAAGLVHRDVKLSNILRERGGRIVLTDFGLGVFITRETESETRGLVAGSPLFMAPEQARGEDVDARTDLYALGVVLYHLTTNKYPVYSDRLPLLLDQIRAGALVSLRDARPDLPEAFTHLVMKALSRHPEARFQSAGEMEQALLSCLGTASTVAENRAALPMQSGRNRWRGLELILRLGRREFRLAIGVSLLLLVSAGLFLHWYERPLSIDDIAMAPPEVPTEPEAKGEDSSPVTAARKDPDHAAVLRELTEIRDAYELGRVTDLDTLLRLEEFTARYEPICGEQAGELMLHIVEVRTKEGKKALASLLAQEVSPLIASRRYEEAASRLEGIRERYPEVTREVDEELAKISAQARQPGKDPEAAVTSTQFSRDGKVVTASPDRTARVWDAASGKELFVLKGHEDHVTSALFSPDGRKIVTASLDRTARVWDVTSGRNLLTLRGHADAVSFAQFSRDGEKILTASGDMTARIWDVTSGRDLLTLRGHESEVHSAQFSPDGQSILTASLDRTARIWDAASGKEVFTLRGHKGDVYSAEYSPDGQSIVTASLDGTARIWDAASGKELFTLRGHKGDVYSAEYRPDGRTIITASLDRTARIWDAASGKELLVLIGHERGVSFAQFSPDSRRIVTTSWDRTARIWDATSGKELFTLRGHENPVYSAQFSPDGKRMVTASRDRTAQVWDVGSGKEPVTLIGHTSPPTESKSLAICPRCKGRGKVAVVANKKRTDPPCSNCAGSGQVPVKRNLIQKKRE